MATTTQDEVSADIIHLHGDLYRVKYDLIEYADGNFNITGKKLVFQNPRHISTNSGKPLGEGFGKAAMDELFHALVTEGMKNPLSCRWLPGKNKVQLVDGERRKRCIDKLRKENPMVHVPSTGETVSAVEHYEYIDCRIEEMSDESALKHAISMTESSKHFGEGALVLLVQHLRNHNMDDKTILSIMSKSASWLKQSDDILQLDKESLAAFCNNKINRTVALRLLTVDEKKRSILLDKSSEISKARIEKEIEKHDLQIEEAQQELQEVEKEAAEVAGRPRKEKKVSKKISMARDKVDQKVKEKEEVQEKGTAKVILKDLQLAAQEEGLTEEVKPKPLSAVKIQKCYLDVINKLIDNDGVDEESEDIVLESQNLELAKIICEGILQGYEDIIALILEYQES